MFLDLEKSWILRGFSSYEQNERKFFTIENVIIEHRGKFLLIITVKYTLPVCDSICQPVRKFSK